MLIVPKKRAVESAAYPGVTFSVLVARERNRRELRLRIDEASLKQRRLVVRAARMEDDFVAARKAGEKIPEADLCEYAELRDEIDNVQREFIEPAWVAWAISDLKGIGVETDDGERPLSVEKDLLDLPTPLFDEMVGYAREQAGLALSDQKNFKSPSTSSIPVAGETQDTTAETAESKAQ